MPKELFNQSEIVSPNAPADTERMAFGTPSVSGGKTIKWSYFKTLIFSFFNTLVNLTENYIWVGDSNNLPSEVPVSDVISGAAALVSGQYTVTDTNITTNSIVLTGISTTGTLTANLKYTLSAGQCVFSAGGTDTAAFSYYIIY